MGRFVLRRVVSVIVVLFAISVLTFLIFQAIPNGDPALRLAGRLATPQQVEDVRKQWGLDQPIYVQYLKMMEKILSGQVISYTQQVNVLDEIKRGLPATMSLAIGAGIIWLSLGIVFGLLSAIVSKLLAPRLETEAKAAPYECGIVPRKDPPERFPVRFYLVAMIFIIFDIEIIFLYPWAVIFRRLGPFALWEMVLFAAAVFVSFLYLISNGALDWGPVKRLRRVDEMPMVSSERTAATTVKRVGLEGREGRGEHAA